ncbi:MAG: glycosyl transferase [Ilumatobacteraceae bacterium]|nr:glycosyl transferase [Ilumatobacteraceae bacterium]
MGRPEQAVGQGHPGVVTDRRYRRLLAVVIVVALAVRVAWVLWVSREPWSDDGGIFRDPSRYLGFARQIADGNGFTEPFTGQATAYYPPGYPWFLGIITWASTPFTNEPWLAAGLVQAVLGAASVGLAASVTKRVAGSTAALVAAVVYALYPNLIFHTGALLGETLYNFLFLAFLALLLSRPWDASFRTPRIAGCGVVLGLAVMVRPISLAVIPVVVLCWLWTRKDYRVIARWTGALLLGVLVCIVPWTIRNELRLHAFVPISTNTGDNLCMGHADGATGEFKAGLEACQTDFDFSDGISAELGSDKEKQRIAVRGMIDNIDREPWLLWSRTYFMWVRDGDHDGLFAVQSYRLDRWMALDTESRLIWIADRFYWLVVAAGLAGLVQLTRRREPEAYVLVGATVMTALVPLLFFGDQRFKVPVIPLLIIAAACLADGRWGRAQSPIHAANAGDGESEGDHDPGGAEPLGGERVVSRS